MNAKFKIAVIGTRGFPDIQGGVEKHCESLYPLIARDGFKVMVFRRSPYLTSPHTKISIKNIEFCDLWTIKNKYLETIVHSFFASISCIFKRPDLVHIHNIGPSLVLPLLKLFRVRTVVTYHSDNYNHKKWGPLAKRVLKTGERFVGMLADAVVVVSARQLELFVRKTHVKNIPNGVIIRENSILQDFLSDIGVQSGHYILAVARFVPEKGLDLLVDAFEKIKGDLKLVIAGDADHDTDYSRELKRKIKNNPRIVGTGYITGESLHQVFSHARLFVLPSYHEGLPIALLEAMSYGLPVLVSNIPANKEVDLPAERFFQCGDVDDLQSGIEALCDKAMSEDERQHMRTVIAEKYNWNSIAEQTISVYRAVVNDGTGRFKKTNEGKSMPDKTA